MTYAISNTKFQVSAEMVRALCMTLCIVMVLSFAMACNTQVAFCSEVAPSDDPADALTEIGNTIATAVYKGIRSLITPLVILAFAIAGLQFLLGGNQGTEKAKKYMLGACAGMVLVVFAPVIGQFLAEQFKTWGAGELSEYNPL